MSLRGKDRGTGRHSEIKKKGREIGLRLKRKRVREMEREREKERERRLMICLKAHIQ